MKRTLKMHEGEITLHYAQIQSLLRKQFPNWADLPLKKVHSFGTDNVIYRLGKELLIRLPKIDWAVGQIEKEIH